ncbi:MAG: flippase-like domain-containing protein, partial [Flavobacteriaceae bacterium]|nr:flippase-like domain-containing protein [Flavobacteriaceae bacterium]
KKWQTLTSVIKKISFYEAAQQTLAALTVSLVTPNRIGDYGAKAMYYNTEHRKKILFVNFIANGFQFLITLLFGLVGFWKTFSFLNFNISTSIGIGFFCIVVVIGIMGYLFRKKEWFIKGFSLANIWQSYKKIPSQIKWKTFIYSMVRYGVFSCLFYLILQFFGAESSFLETIPFIFSMYLLVSVIPTFLVVDILVRGSIAIGLLTLLNIHETVITATVFSMWFLNFLLPATVGSYYVLKFKKV